MTRQKWIDSTNAIGIISKSGRYGGTYAHYDLAMDLLHEFHQNLSFILFKTIRDLSQAKIQDCHWGGILIMKFPRLTIKFIQMQLKNIFQRILQTNNYPIKYANEADMLNVALFNKKAKEWNEENPELKGNMRDYSSINELLVLATMESYNAVLISKGMEQKERMIELRNLDRRQLVSIEKLNNIGIRRLERNK